MYVIHITVAQDACLFIRLRLGESLYSSEGQGWSLPGQRITDMKKESAWGFFEPRLRHNHQSSYTDGSNLLNVGVDETKQVKDKEMSAQEADGRVRETGARQKMNVMY